jgi:hypothetical protein
MTPLQNGKKIDKGLHNSKKSSTFAADFVENNIKN